MHVLVVPDRGRDPATVRQWLSECGHAPHSAADADAAVSHVAATQPDLVIIDYATVGDVPALSRALGSAAATPRPATLAINGPAEPRARTALLDAGIDDVLPAPLDRPQFVTRLAVIDHRAGLRHAPGGDLRPTDQDAAGASHESFSLDAQGRFTAISDAARPLLGHDPGDLVGSSFGDLVDGPNGEPGDVLERLLRISDVAMTFDVPLKHADGTTRPTRVRVRPRLDDAGAVAAVHGSIREVAVQAAPALDHRSSARRQSLLAEFGQLLAAGVDWTAVLSEAVSRLTQGLAVEYGAVVERPRHAASLIARASSGWPASESGRPTVGALAYHQTNLVLELGRSVVLDDARADPALAEVVAAEPTPVSGVTVIIHGVDGPFGTLAAYSTQPREFSASEVQFITSIANLLATAQGRNHASALADHVALHDPLTDLPRRSLFNDRIAVALAQARRSSQLLAVLFADLDGFRRVNETFGHDVGDGILLETARRLQTTVREADTVARLGGDEFLLLLPGIHREADAERTAERVLSVFQAPFETAARSIRLGASVGIGLYPAHGADPETLIVKAERGMDQVKAAGGGAYRFYTPDLDEGAWERFALLDELHRAQDRDELVLHYQPQVRVDSGDVVAMEALIRWQHPRHGLLTPGQFLPLAEESRLIHSIGAWVLHTACAQMQAWHAAGHERLRVAVNLSELEFNHPDIVATVSAALDASGLPAQFLELEVRESAVLRHAAFTNLVLEPLRAMGVRISLDGFGAEFTSLNVMRRFALDTIKVDETITRNVGDTSAGGAIAKAIVQAARGLGIDVVAEGVELERDATALGELEFDGIQGWIVGRPVPADQALDALADLRPPARSA